MHEKAVLWTDVLQEAHLIIEDPCGLQMCHAEGITMIISVLFEFMQWLLMYDSVEKKSFSFIF